VSIPDRLRSPLAARYELIEEIGRGGMATVYLARDLKHGRRVALKVLRPELAAAIGPDRFLREIEISATLRHPNILPLFDSGEAEGFLFYVMPYVEGESLRARLERERQLPLEDAYAIALEVADALGYAHSHGVVHRDVKPENVLLESGHAVVADFGIARAIDAAPASRLTETGLAIGTPAYMSPEQASGDEVDGRSDQYSLACVLYESLAGEPPHPGPTPGAILARSLTGEVRPIHPVRHTVSSALDGVLQRALAATPADRYPTCHEFAEAVRAVTRQMPAPSAPASRRAAQMLIRPLLTVLAIVVVGLLARRLLSPPPAAAIGRLGLAVFPFRETAGGAGEWSEALGDLLATALDGTPGVRVVDPWSLWGPLRPSQAARAAPPDPAEGRRLALEAGARRFLLGSVLQREQRLDVTLRLYEAGTPDPVYTVTDSGTVPDLPALIQRLAVSVIRHVWENERLPEVRDIQGYTTRSSDALKAYLDARIALRRGLLDSADHAIDRAVALDSNFALALVEATRIKSWTATARGLPYTGLLPLATRAASHADSLSERNRDRVLAMLAMVRTNGRAAADAIEQILALDSMDFDAWDMLRYTRTAYGWQYGATAAQARAAAERVVRLDSTFVPALVARAWIAAAGGDTADVTLQIRRLSLRDTTQPLVQSMLYALRAEVASDSAFGAMLPALAGQPAAGLITAVRFLRPSRPARAEQLLQHVRTSGAAGRPPDFALGPLAQLWLAEGNVQRADSLLASGALNGSPYFRRMVQLNLVAADLAGVGVPAIATRTLTDLERDFPPDSAAAYFETRPIWWAGWLIGAHHAASGDPAVAERWSAALGRLPQDSTASPREWVPSLQADLAARLAGRRGDLSAALRDAQQAYRLWDVHSDNQSEAAPEPSMRLHLAMLHLASGHADSAAVYLRSLVPPTTWMGYLTARAWYELGRIATRRGNVDEAADALTRALELWDLGGDDVAAWRQRAREELQGLAQRGG
jgi:tRNA A-37 threonylcarbamoyl transferase component Bud32/tetratricopeptide (TPR) repeat protein